MLTSKSDANKDDKDDEKGKKVPKKGVNELIPKEPMY
jgi:hypothetical protein